MNNNGRTVLFSIQFCFFFANLTSSFGEEDKFLFLLYYNDYVLCV